MDANYEDDPYAEIANNPKQAIRGLNGTGIPDDEQDDNPDSYYNNHDLYAAQAHAGRGVIRGLNSSGIPTDEDYPSKHINPYSDDYAIHSSFSDALAAVEGLNNDSQLGEEGLLSNDELTRAHAVDRLTIDSATGSPRVRPTAKPSQFNRPNEIAEAKYNSNFSQNLNNGATENRSTQQTPLNPSKSAQNDDSNQLSLPNSSVRPDEQRFLSPSDYFAGKSGRMGTISGSKHRPNFGSPINTPQTFNSAQRPNSSNKTSLMSPYAVEIVAGEALDSPANHGKMNSFPSSPAHFELLSPQYRTTQAPQHNPAFSPAFPFSSPISAVNSVQPTPAKLLHNKQISHIQQFLPQSQQNQHNSPLNSPKQGINQSVQSIRVPLRLNGSNSRPGTAQTVKSTTNTVNSTSIQLLQGESLNSRLLVSPLLAKVHRFIHFSLLPGVDNDSVQRAVDEFIESSFQRSEFKLIYAALKQNHQLSSSSGSSGSGASDRNHSAHSLGYSLILIFDLAAHDEGVALNNNQWKANFQAQFREYLAAEQAVQFMELRPGSAHS
jgi:hypothetical protein